MRIFALQSLCGIGLLSFTMFSTLAAPESSETDQECRKSYPFITQSKSVGRSGGIDFDLLQQVYGIKLGLNMTRIDCSASVETGSDEQNVCLRHYHHDEGFSLFLVRRTEPWDDDILARALKLDVFGKAAYLVPERLDDTYMDGAYTINSDGSSYGLVYVDAPDRFDGPSMAALFPLILRMTYVCE